MTRTGAKITTVACVGALALMSATSWASAPQARGVVAEAVAAGARASAEGQVWSGWSREGATLERANWTARAQTVERTPEGWVARGDARLSGPAGLYVRAPLLELEEGRATALAEGASKAALVGSGWTLEGARVEVDLARPSARIIEMGSRDEMTR